MNTTIEDLIKSNGVKKEACERCKMDLKDILTSEQLEKFENAFYSATKGCIFTRKEH